MDNLETTKFSIRDFLYIVFKRKTEMLLFFAATFCTVAISTYVAERKYEANSRLMVKIGRESVFVPTEANSSPILNIDRREYINAEIEIIKSRPLAEKAVKSLGPTVIYKRPKDKERKKLWGLFPKKPEPKAQQSPLENATSKLQKSLTVEGIENSNVIEVRYKHTDPKMSATVLNKFVNDYLDHRLSVHKNPQTSTFFRDQSQILKNKLKRAEEKLRVFKKQYGIISLDEERSLILRQESALQDAYNQTLSEEAETAKRLARLRKQLGKTPKSIRHTEQSSSNRSLITNLEARLVELELKEEELLTKYTNESRLVRNVRDEIKIVRKKLAEQEAKRYGTSSSGLNVTYQRLKGELLQNEARLDALKAKKDIQSGQLVAFRKRLQKLNQIETDLYQLQQDVEVDRRNYQLYLTRSEESRLSNAMDLEKIASVSVIEPARPPLKPVSPKVFLSLALGVFLGVLGGLGLALFLEYLNDSLERPEDAEDAVHVPVLASIPRFPGPFSRISELRPRAMTEQSSFRPKRRSYGRGFALVSSILLAICLIFAIGYFLGNLFFKHQGVKSLSHNSALVAPKNETQGSGQAPSPTLSDAYYYIGIGSKEASAGVTEKKLEQETGLSDKQINDHKVSAGTTEYTETAATPVKPEPIKDEINLGTPKKDKNNDTPEQDSTIKQKPDSKITTANVTTSKNMAAKGEKFLIQVGAFREITWAEQLKENLQQKGHDAYVDVQSYKGIGGLYLVRLRDNGNMTDAKSKKALLKKQGFKKSFIVIGGN